MSDKMLPIRPPKLPPAVEKKELTGDLCVIHNGPLDAKVYVCEKCGAKMCHGCALKRKRVENKPFCPRCTAYLFVKE